MPSACQERLVSAAATWSAAANAELHSSFRLDALVSNARMMAAPLSTGSANVRLHIYFTLKFCMVTVIIITHPICFHYYFSLLPCLYHGHSLQ